MLHTGTVDTADILTCITILLALTGPVLPYLISWLKNHSWDPRPFDGLMALGYGLMTFLVGMGIVMITAFGEFRFPPWPPPWLPPSVPFIFAIVYGCRTWASSSQPSDRRLNAATGMLAAIAGMIVIIIVQIRAVP